jgi:radical SAM protein with 4Fe4S-binding SPASM domain
MFNCITFTTLLPIEDLELTVDYFYHKKGMRTCLTQICREGLAIERPEWKPDPKEIKESVSIRDSINYPNSNISMSTMDTNKFYCGGAICVTIDGDVTPCSVIRKGFGNVINKSLKDILEENANELLYMELRNNKNLPNSCKSCNNNTVCWGCRASAYYEMGNIMAEDPNCSFGK